MLALTQKSILGGNSVFSFGIPARDLLNNCNRCVFYDLPSMYTKVVSYTFVLKIPSVNRPILQEDFTIVQQAYVYVLYYMHGLVHFNTFFHID